jgi:hypothetical protein
MRSCTRGIYDYGCALGWTGGYEGSHRYPLADKARVMKDIML